MENSRSLQVFLKFARSMGRGVGFNSIGFWIGFCLSEGWYFQLVDAGDKASEVARTLQVRPSGAVPRNFIRRTQMFR